MECFLHYSLGIRRPFLRRWLVGTVTFHGTVTCGPLCTVMSAFRLACVLSLSSVSAAPLASPGPACAVGRAGVRQQAQGCVSAVVSLRSVVILLTTTLSSPSLLSCVACHSCYFMSFSFLLLTLTLVEHSFLCFLRETVRKVNLRHYMLPRPFEGCVINWIFFLGSLHSQLRICIC